MMKWENVVPEGTYSVTNSGSSASYRNGSRKTPIVVYSNGTRLFAPYQPSSSTANNGFVIFQIDKSGSGSDTIYNLTELVRSTTGAGKGYTMVASINSTEECITFMTNERVIRKMDTSTYNFTSFDNLYNTTWERSFWCELMDISTDDQFLVVDGRKTENNTTSNYGMRIYDNNTKSLLSIVVYNDYFNIGISTSNEIRIIKFLPNTHNVLIITYKGDFLIYNIDEPDHPISSMRAEDLPFFISGSLPATGYVGVMSICFSQDNTYVYLFGYNGTSIAGRVHIEKREFESIGTGFLSTSIVDSKMSPDGTKIMCCDTGGRFSWYNIITGKWSLLQTKEDAGIGTGTVTGAFVWLDNENIAVSITYPTDAATNDVSIKVLKIVDVS
jgi:hypothetical protein